MSSHTHSLKRWTAILGTTFCMLVSGMLYVIWRDGQTDKDTSTANVEILDIRVLREGFEEIQLSKIEEQWQIESPCKLTANEQRLSPLIGVLTPDTHLYTASEVDLDAAGLTNPKAIVYINGVEHRIGNTDLHGERRYVQRDNVVIFAPEWVLSLINGGVTAFAQLEIFSEPLSRMIINDDRGNSRDLDLPDELTLWQNLSAQQISTWPLPDAGSTQHYQIQAIDTNNNKHLYTVYENESLTAIRLDGAACAYILPADALPK